jgi:GNAT superfamily N-acetyltransferase
MVQKAEKGMGIEVSRLHPQDRPRWADLWRAYLAFYETALPEEQYEDTWARLLHDTAVHGLAARRDGVIIGITHFLFHAHCWTTAPACYLQDLYVEESARGVGAGRALIEGVADRARERAACRMYWLTQDHNAPARRLYDAIAGNSGFIRYEYNLG